MQSYDSDVRGYEVYKDDILVSYYFLDPFYRKEKRGGAWANNLRERQYEVSELAIGSALPVVLNVCNFMK